MEGWWIGRNPPAYLLSLSTFSLAVIKWQHLAALLLTAKLKLFFFYIFMITFCGTWMHPKRVNSEGVKNVFECVIASCPPSVGVGPAALISLILL